MMPLREFLRRETNAGELCVIRDAGWTVAVFWIDYEDLFCRYIHKDLADRKVKKDSWGNLPTTNKNKEYISIPCHYIDI